MLEIGAGHRLVRGVENIGFECVQLRLLELVAVGSCIGGEGTERYFQAFDALLDLLGRTGDPLGLAVDARDDAGRWSMLPVKLVKPAVAAWLRSTWASTSDDPILPTARNGTSWATARAKKIKMALQQFTRVVTYIKLEPNLAQSQIIAVGLLTPRDLDVLGSSFTRHWPVDETPCFHDLLQAIDEADRTLRQWGEPSHASS